MSRLRNLANAALQTEVAALNEAAASLRWVVDNIYTIARREAARNERGKPLRPEMWGHVQRLCEKTGAQSRTVGVLREEDLSPSAREAGCVSAEERTPTGESKDTTNRGRGMSDPR